MQSENDPLSELRMQVDEPPDTNTTMPRSTPPTPPSTQPKVSLPEQTVQHFCQALAALSQTSSEPDYIQDFLPVVWALVNKYLKQDPNLRSRLAGLEEFEENVKEKGEQQFIDLLKDMAKKENWQGLLENGTSFLPLT